MIVGVNISIAIVELVVSLWKYNFHLVFFIHSFGFYLPYEEDQKLHSSVWVVEIFNSYVIIEDENNKFYQVYMNNLIQEIDG